MEKRFGDHSSEDEDEGLRSTGKSSTPTGAEGQSEKIRQEVVETPSVESVVDVPIRDEGPTTPSSDDGREN